MVTAVLSLSTTASSPAIAYSPLESRATAVKGDHKDTGQHDVGGDDGPE